MRTLLLGTVVGVALLNTATAHAMTAYADDAVTLHAGPSPNYPAVEQLSKDTRLWVIGCRETMDWCDVTHGRTRGWVRASALGIPNEPKSTNGISVAKFDLDSYWHDNYRHEAFYAERAQWRDLSTQIAQGSGDFRTAP